MIISKFITLTRIFCILFLVFFSGILSAKGLNASELKALINDKTVESKSASGYAAKTYYSPDGTFRRSKRGKIKKGTWSINNDGELCKKVKGESTAVCRKIVKSSDVWKVYKVFGNITMPWKHKSTWLKILNGNPNKL